MTNFSSLPLLALALVLAFPAGRVLAEDDESLREQRRAAHKERQQARNERSKKIREATKTFKAFARDLETEYAQKARELDTAFELERVELEARRDAEIATAEAEYRQKMTGLFMAPGTQFDEATIERLQSEWKAYADELFGSKRKFAELSHGEEMAKEREKQALFDERDRVALEEASRLGLTDDYRPILAEPIGDGLTDREKKWNEKERKEVERIEERNLRTTREFRIGGRLREWELENRQEDFEIAWREKAEAHELDSREVFFNSLLLQAAQGGEVDQQDLAARFSELAKERELVKIEYDKIRKRRRIERREEKRKILGK